jgi:TRAP-type C4-dicarboxylate transport system permease small subunit
MVEHESTSLIDRVAIVISRVAMMMVAVIVVIIFFEVIMRYLFERPTIWVNEMSLWLGGAIYLFSGLYVMQQRAHIRIFILYDMCPRWVQRIFDTISTIFICLFAFAVVYGGTTEAWQKLMRWETFGTAWDPPIPATMKPLVLLVVVLIAIQAVANLIADWNREKEVHDPADELK